MTIVVHSKVVIHNKVHVNEQNSICSLIGLPETQRISNNKNKKKQKNHLALLLPFSFLCLPVYIRNKYS